MKIIFQLYHGTRWVNCYTVRIIKKGDALVNGLPWMFFTMCTRGNADKLLQNVWCLYVWGVTNKVVTSATVKKQFQKRHYVNSLWPSDVIWSQIWVNTGSCDGLLPDGRKSLYNSMLTYCKRHSTESNFIRNAHELICNMFRRLHFQNHYILQGANELLQWTLDI